MPYWMQNLPGGRYGPIPRSTKDEVKTTGTPRSTLIPTSSDMGWDGMGWNGMVERAKWTWSIGEPSQEPALDARGYHSVVNRC